MKKYFFPVLASVVVLLFACNGGDGKTHTLQPSFKAGDKYSLEYKVVMDQNMNSMSNKVTMTMAHLLDVKNVSPKNETDLELKYSRISMAMKAGDVMDVAYDSDSTYPPNSTASMSANMNLMIREIYAKIFGTIINKPVRVTLEPNGKIKSVNGYSELLQAIKDTLQAYGGPGASGSLDGLVGNQQVSEVFQRLFSVVPQKPVRVGESWTGELETESNGIKMKTKNTYKLVEVLEKENVAFVDVKGTIQSTGDKKIVQDGVEMTVDLSGTSEGRIEIDLSTGISRSGKLTQDVNITVESNRTGKMPMTMKLVTTIAGKKM